MDEGESSNSEDDLSVSEYSDSSSDAAPSLELDFVESPLYQSRNNMGTSMSRESDDDTTTSQRKITFNRNLPADHPYLGNDLEEVIAGQNVFESDSIADNIPLLPVPDFVLMPNQILPLNNFHPRLVSMFRTIIASAKCFGVVSINSEEAFYDSDEEIALANVGTIAQVLAYKEGVEHELTFMKMRVVGRQRFKILSTRHQDSILIGKIKILPDIELRNFIDSIEPTCSTSCKIKSSKKYDLRRNHLLASVHAPPFIYNMYNMQSVIKRLTSELTKWYDEKLINDMCKNPTAFSFWVASNLPMQESTKLALLSCNCDLQRLKRELQLILQCTAFACKCGQHLGKSSHVFSMSVIGPLSVFVNPHGSLHELLTLSRLVNSKNVVCRGSPQTEFSWFPGYAWTIVECKRCGKHLGWHFTLDKQLDFEPKQFWGLSRRSIDPILHDAESEEDPLKLPAGPRA